jgi:hypothetical protein
MSRAHVNAGESDSSLRAHSNNENDCLFLGEIGFRFG